jgi:hypothetical protein
MAHANNLMTSIFRKDYVKIKVDIIDKLCPITFFKESYTVRLNKCGNKIK